jgi:hypothetical protein
VIGVSGGTVTVEHTSIIWSDAAAECFRLDSGELHLSSTIVEATSPQPLLLVPSDATDNPLFVAVLTDFRLHDCNGSHFVRRQGTGQVVLKAVTFTPLAGCNAINLASPAVFDSITSTRCGDTYTDSARRSWGVCSSASPGACRDRPITGTVLQSVDCDCPSPEYVNTDAGDAVLAPYRASGGCISPMRLTDLTIVSRKVLVSLKKPFQMERSLNITLRVEGDDVVRPARWIILNASLVQTRSTWLQLPAVSGDTNAQAIAAGNHEVLIPLGLYATGLRERAASYEETLLIDVRSEYTPVAKTQLLEVALTVQASTSFAVWGRILPGMRCKLAFQGVLDGRTTTGEVRRVAFTACDCDNLPVDHQLPTPGDTRRFSVWLNTSTITRDSVAFEYLGGGTYDAILEMQTHGALVTSLELEGDTLGQLNGIAECPIDRVPLAEGRCGCRAGFFQPTMAEPCELCTTVRTSSFEGAIGAARCNDVCNPGFFWPSPDTNPWDTSSAECTLCTAVRGSTCQSNATILSLNLTTGWWRHSNVTNQTWRCRFNGAWSPCGGGISSGSSGDGYCKPGYHGPRERIESTQHMSRLAGMHCGPWPLLHRVRQAAKYAMERLSTASTLTSSMPDAMIVVTYLSRRLSYFPP